MAAQTTIAFLALLLFSVCFECFGEAKAKLTTEQTYWLSTKPVNVSVGSGLALWRDRAGFAVNVSPMTRASDDLPIYIGADVGIATWRAPMEATAIAVLPSVFYGFTVADSSRLHPYLGVAVGPNFYLENQGTRIFLEMLLRPGASYQLTNTLAVNVEPKVGLLKTDFIFLPQVSVVFAL